MTDKINYLWQELSTNNPIDGEVYAVIINYAGNETKVREGLIFKDKHPVADIQSYFQDEYCYNMNLYEMMYRIDEGIITHFKKQIPLPI